MATKPIDYEALAKQSGAISSAPPAVDYAALAKQSGAISSQPKTTTVIKAAPEEWSIPWLKEKLYNIADSLTNTLPTAGATAGALIGGGSGLATLGTTSIPGAVGGAGIGGMAGEALKQHVRRALGFEDVPQTSADAAKAITKEGAIQGGTQAITEGIPLLAGPLRSAATKQYGKALAAGTNENKAIAEDIVPQMIDRKIYGGLPSLEQMSKENIAKTRPRLEQAYSNVSAGPIRAQNPVDATINTLDNLQQRYVVDGKVVNQKAVDAIDAVKDVVGKHQNDISPQSLRKIKQIFDESVSEAGGYTTSDLTTNYELKAQKAAANRIRDILHSPNPDVAALDKEMAFWLDVQQVTKATNLRRVGQEGGLVKTLGPLAVGTGAAAGLPMGVEGSMAGASLAALTTALGYAVRSPQWRTASAVMKNQLANAISRGDVKMGIFLLGKLGVAASEVPTEPRTEDHK